MIVLAQERDDYNAAAPAISLACGSPYPEIHSRCHDLDCECDCHYYDDYEEDWRP